MSTLASVLMILTFLFGGTGATVYAAQGSLPDQLLYPVKLASEDVRGELAPSTQTRLELALQFASRRAEEMAAMIQAGKQPPASLLARWQGEVDQALRLSAGLDDSQMNQSLQQVRQTLHAQEGNLNQVQASVQTEPILQRVRDMLQTRLQLVENGLADPQTFRVRARNGQFEESPTTVPTTGATPGTGAGTPGTGAGNPWTTGTPTPGSGYGSGNGGNPWTDTTPTPGSSYGPGPGDCTTCTPSGQGTGNPWTDTTPTPGSGYGPGPNPTSAMGTGPQSTPQQGATQGSGGGNNDGGGGPH